MDLKYLALGDSYTVGEGVTTEFSWPFQLAERLRAEGFSIADPEIIAKTGWTTAELIAGMDLVPLRPSYDLVSLLIGVNNQYRGEPAAKFELEFGKLLDRSVQLARGSAHRVLVLSIPDWSVTPFAGGCNRTQIRDEIDHLNLIGRDAADRAGARYVDITPVSRNAKSDHSLLAEDGLHPSGSMYRDWSILAVPLALAALRAGAIR